MAVTYPPHSTTTFTSGSASGLFQLIETEVQRGGSSVSGVISVIEVNLGCGATGGRFTVWPAVGLQPS